MVAPEIVAVLDMLLIVPELFTVLILPLFVNPLRILLLLIVNNFPLLVMVEMNPGLARVFISPMLFRLIRVDIVPTVPLVKEVIVAGLALLIELIKLPLYKPFMVPALFAIAKIVPE